VGDLIALYLGLELMSLRLRGGHQPIPALD
jgi:hypothetical protein